jgi:hypothetical protein
MRRALAAIGGGYGSVIAATPVISALREMDYVVDVLVESPAYEAATLVSGWGALETIYLTRKTLRLREKDRGYQVVVRTIRNRNGTLGVGPEFRPGPGAQRDAHEVELNLSALARLGWSGECPGCHVERDEPFWPLPERFAVVAPGVSWRKEERKRVRWPHWERFCELLHESTGMDVMVVGEEGDVKRWMDSEGRPWLHNLCGVTSIRGAAGIILRCEMLYAVDNSLGWIGAALGRPVVSLFGPTNEKTEGPEGESALAVSSMMSCRPCRYSARWEYCLEARCMEALRPEQVLNVGMMKESRVAV